MRHSVLATALASTCALTGMALADLAVGGRVVDDRTGQPVTGANVVAGARSTTTDADGAFRLDRVEADSIAVSHVGYRPATVAAAPGSLRIALVPALLPLPAVVVRAGLTEERLSRATQSVTVVVGQALGTGGATHLQDLAASVPNLNWAGGTARPQYYQLRGVGESSRYAGEGPPSFTVGSVADDVDLSGLATAGLLFDLGQVEVHRGPQSTVFGSNAMAGLIHARSRDPEPVRDLGLAGRLGGDGLAGLDGYANLPLRDDLALRAGYGASRADGFRHNDYLDRDDTNRRREGVARAKLLWTPGSARVTATAFRVDLDNGYDAWAPDNNEELVSYADCTGVDRQETRALSLRAEVPVRAALRLVAVSALAHTDGEYSYDGDWGNDAFWRQAPYGFDPAVEGWRYAFFDHMRRDRTTWTQELRAVGADLPGVGGEGVVGLWAKGLEEATDATGYLFGGEATALDATYRIDGLALYGQLVRQLSPRVRLAANLRVDRSATAYDGTTTLSDGSEAGAAFDAGDWLPGGRLAVDVSLDGARTLFVAAARGYRAGGVNQHPRLADANRSYDPEYLWSLEAGARHTGEASRLALTLFHGRRGAQQVELSTQQDPGDPNSFVYFTNNAGRGWNAGAELEGSWQAAPTLRLAGSLGLLATHLASYTFRTAQGESLTLGDREAAHAPTWNLRGAIDWGRDRGPRARLEATGMDGFYYSESHDQRSKPYGLLRGSLGWGGDGWRLELWGRNLLDERYAVRGFYFGLEPPDYADRLYVSYGDPRQVGATLSAQVLDLGSWR